MKIGMFVKSLARWTHHAAAGAAVLPAPWSLPLARRSPQKTRTGGPDNDDEDEDLKVLMPILAVVIVVAVMFGG